MPRKVQTPQCPCRFDPEGDHANGYRCTLPRGHGGDHEAYGLYGQAVYGWSPEEGAREASHAA